jgi:hypothetical protein
MTDPVPSKDLLSLLNDAQAFVGKSRCSLGHSVDRVRDNAKAGRCIYCKQQYELYERIGQAFQRLPHEPCEQPSGYLHQITEPGGGVNQMYSSSGANPWSHWVESHRDQCIYSCTPLYARPAQPPRDGQ